MIGAGTLERLIDVLNLEGFVPRSHAFKMAPLVIDALRYVDGIDEERAVLVSQHLAVDAVIAIECWDTWLASIIPPASAGEAGTAKTTEIGLAEGEHAVAKPDAQKEQS